MSNTAADKIKRWMKPGRVYRRQELLPLSSNMTRDLAKLVQDQTLIQAAPGLYYLPELTRFGPRPASDDELIRTFLKDGDYLITSLNNYNSLGLGLTQLYNEKIVYNRKRHGHFKLDGRMFYFRRPRNFPNKLSKEFLLVDLLNNRNELAEDTEALEDRLKSSFKDANRESLLRAARRYGKVYTLKFFEKELAA